MKSLSEYKNDEGGTVTSITAVRIFGNDRARHIVDENGIRITALEKVPMSELAELAKDAPIWMGDHGPIEPPVPPSHLELLRKALVKEAEQKSAPPNQSDLEFIITYPAYIVLIDQQAPQCVMMKDDWCLCLFTDKDLAESFVEKYYPPDKLPKNIEYVRQSGPRDLLRSLVQNEPVMTKEGVRHLAIDVTPGLASLQVLISDAIKILSYEVKH